VLHSRTAHCGCREAEERAACLQLTNFVAAKQSGADRSATRWCDAPIVAACGCPQGPAMFRRMPRVRRRIRVASNVTRPVILDMNSLLCRSRTRGRIDCNVEIGRKPRAGKQSELQQEPLVLDSVVGPEHRTVSRAEKNGIFHLTFSLHFQFDADTDRTSRVDGAALQSLVRGPSRCKRTVHSGWSPPGVRSLMSELALDRCRSLG